MKQSILLLFIFWMNTNAFGQSINPLMIDQQQLEQLILQKINLHRTSLGLSVLNIDASLAPAAADHSNYQRDYRTVTHYQTKNKAKRSPYQRVQYFGATHGTIGENCAMITIGSASNIQDYETAAQQFYTNWKNSSGHYANMINDDFRVSSIRFAISRDGKYLYATHVFGGVPYKNPDGVKVTSNSHGVLERQETTCQTLLHKQAAYFASSLYRIGDSLFFQYNDVNILKEVIQFPNDGLAIDIIENRQFPCASANEFHGSPVHDGVMLRPIYKEELFKNNQSSSPTKLRSFVGKIPKALQFKDINHSVIVIKNGCICDYGYYINIPNRQLPLFNIAPIWAFSEIADQYSLDSIPTINQIRTLTSINEYSAQLNIHFDKNQSNLSIKEQEKIQAFLHKENGKVKTIFINAFSSVEGTKEINIRLQNQRANAIKSILKKYGYHGKVEITVKENWDQFYNQIKNSPWSDLSKLSKSTIKSKLKSLEKDPQMMQFLSAQRTANIQIQLEETIEEELDFFIENTSSNEEIHPLVKQFEEHIKSGFVQLALYDQYQMVMELLYGNMTLRDFTRTEIPIKKEFLPHLSNQLAAKLFLNKYVSIDKKLLQQLRAIQALDASYLPMQFNYSGYAIRYMYQTQKSIIPPLQLNEAIHTMEENETYNIVYQNKQEVFERLKINFHLAASDYFWENLEYEKRNASLIRILEFFEEAEMTQIEALHVAQFFNRNYKSEWALDILQPYLDSKKHTIPTLHTYAKTLTLIQEDKQDEAFLKIIDEWILKDQKRFCKWVNRYFQLKRYSTIKERYCQYCD